MTTLTLADVHTLHEKVRAERPLVHNITNFVAMNIAANVLLAAGASPAMVRSRKACSARMDPQPSQRR